MLTDAPAPLERPAPGGFGRHARWIVPVAVFALGLAVPLRETDLLHAAPGNIGDARFNTVILEHFYRWLTGRDSSIMSPPFFYPMPGVLSFSDNHWGTAWIYSIFRAFGAGRYLAYDLWYLVGFAANFAAMHVALRRFGTSVFASALGAFVFAFALPVSYLATEHGQFAYRCLAPVALLCLHRFLQGRSPLWLGWCALAVAGQFYIAIYSGFFVVLVLGAWAVGVMATRRRALPEFLAAVRLHWSEGRRPFWVTGAMLVGAALLTAALMYPYVHYPSLYGLTRDSSIVKPFLPRLGSYLIADYSWIWDGPSASVSIGDAARSEQQMFVGLSVLVAAVAGVLLARGTLKRAALVSLLIPVLLTIDIGGHSVYLPLADLPGVGAIRAVARIIALLILPVAVLAALGVDAVRAKGRWGSLAGCALLALIAFEALSLQPLRFDISQENQRVAAVEHTFTDGIHHGDVVFLPVTTTDITAIFTELDGMVIAQDHDASTLNGYSGSAPPGYSWAQSLSGCDQAQARILAARDFELETLHRTLPPTTFAHLNVAGDPACVARTGRDLPAPAMAKVQVAVVHVEPVSPGTWSVTARVSNGSRFTLDDESSPKPMRLSWHVRPGSRPAVVGQWKPRVKLPADVAPGDSEDVTFTLKAAHVRAPAVDVELVIEGRTWLYTHGGNLASAELPARRGS